jgi:hypothetical protein|tara:strand:- start:805 stop:1287 length:483 start_codon:yes stop_codon:yes gene_type:complete
MSSEFQTLVQGQSIGSITPQQILAAGQPVFLDIKTNADIVAINKLIESYGRIHAPTYGQPIPMSGLVSTSVGSEVVLAPSSNEIRKIVAVSVTNAGAAPVIGTLTLGGVHLGDFSVDPTSSVAVEISNIFASKNLQLAVSVSGGTASDLTTKVASILTNQ